MSGIIAFEAELNSIVKEYLEFNGLDKSSVVFMEECEDKDRKIAPPDPRPLTNQDNVAAQGGDPVEEMAEFRNFIESKGSTLSQTSEFLPYYALPFVPNAKVHPSFKELFSDSWVPDLQVRLQKFLSITLHSKPQPRLFEIYRGGPGKENIVLQEQIVDAERKAAAYLKRFNRLQIDYRNLIAITADLVDTLERSVQGEMVTPEYLEKMCSRLFSNQVRQSVNLSRPGTAAEMLRQSVLPPQGLQPGESMPNKSLDYDRIKHDLTEGGERLKALLLQALRWVFHQQTTLDLLTHSNAVVKEYKARLLNTIASLNEGRSYLSKHALLLPALMDALHEETVESRFREHALGCLQKLSLRHDQQTRMIDLGIIEWLVKVLEDTDSLSEYSLEYSVALLMNVCLRTSGKTRCCANPSDVLRVLANLLALNNRDINAYVNGTLYAILSMQPVREEGRKMGLEELLTSLMKEEQQDMNRQFEFIIKQLNSNEQHDEESDAEDEDDEEEILEPDLDKNEIVRPEGRELGGDRLLNTNYVTASPARSKKKQLDALKDDEMLTRPVTPGQRHNSTAPVVHVKNPSRPTSKNSRPPTRTGSRPNSGEERPSSKSSNHSRGSSKGQNGKPLSRAHYCFVKKLTFSLNTFDRGEDYSNAFSSRPKIPRTPDASGGRSSQVGRSAPPQPNYSESLPTPRPGSGGSQLK
ncbi:DgyrCDS11322 [Dimorphilus gyrociliatus]|uniref:LisH domain-containing protein ARMC9 n=1 Tax=Dimorphilus gyrociliatus TaxID=2664684 RepID=A0A7I8W7Q4_9ANNE|nr:DgyrCDS11322 [Dimorphilus gyrociliatus]